MRRKIIALLGVGGSLLLLFSCVIAIAIAGIAGWWFLGQEGQSRIVRIISLAPLGTPEAAPQAEDEVSTVPVLPEEVEPVTIPEVQAETVEEVTPDEIEEALGFAVPEGAVNSITQVGLANRLVIPKLKVDAPIVLSPIENQSWKVDHLGQSVGHLEGTAAPGSQSNVVLAAHVTLSAGVYGPFAGLGQLVPGDTIVVYDDGQQFNYVIDGHQIVDRTAIQVTDPTDTGQLTLITCSNWDHNEQRYIDRLVVTSSLVRG